MLKRHYLIIIPILVTTLFAALLIVEIFLPFRPQTSAAIIAVKSFGGGVNPWRRSKIIAVIDAIPQTTTVLVDYTNSQQRCMATHQVNQRLLSGTNISSIENVCDIRGTNTAPFEVRGISHSNLYVLMGFSHDEDVKYVQAVWDNGDVQEAIIDDSVFFFYRDNADEIKHIVGMNNKRQHITNIFSLP